MVDCTQCDEPVPHQETGEILQVHYRGNPVHQSCHPYNPTRAWADE